MNLKSLNEKVKFSVKNLFFSKFEFAIGNPTEDSVLFQITDLKPNGNWAYKGAILVPALSLIFLSLTIRYLILKIFFLALVIVISALIWDRFFEKAIMRESVLVIRNEGIELFKETVSGDIVDVQFYEKSQINQILINEGITIWRVVVYVVIELISKKSQQRNRLGRLVLPFTYFRCPIAVSVQVASGIREYLGLSK
jgi:hypothetical protein